MQSVFVEANSRLLDKVVEIRIEKAHARSLEGTVVTGTYSGVTGVAAQPSSHGGGPSMEAAS